MEDKEYILCAAIHYNDGEKYTHQPKNINEGIVICGRRHHNCITTIAGLKKEYDKKLLMRDSQGFITNTDRFVSRKEAYIIAKKAGQLLHNLHDDSNPILISEDLYSEDLF